jgi:5'-3' exonuclease
MGVPGLGRVISVAYPSVTDTVPPKNVDNAEIDLNGAFHTVAGNVLNYGEERKRLEKKKAFDEIERRDQQVKSLTLPQIEEKIFTGIGTYIEQVVALLKPSKRLILAVDGLAPIAKLNHQRARRLKSGLDRLKSEIPGERIFNGSGNFTPGTELMMRLNLWLRNWLVRNEHKLPPYVWFSDHMDPGEGEHKLLEFTRTLPPEEVTVINGMDGDLIMLGLLLPHNYIVLRSFGFKLYGRFEPENVRANYIYVRDLANRLTSENVGINEFVFSMFLFGNDFLPAQPGLTLSKPLSKDNNVFDNLLECLRGRHFIEDSEINVEEWQRFVSDLLTVQYSSIELISTTAISYPFFPGIEAMIDGQLNPELFTQVWTNRIFNYPIVTYAEEDVENNIIEYLTTLQWVWQYYHGHRGVDWSYCYPRIHAPLLNQLANANTIYDISPHPYKLTVPGQLMAVIPRNSRDLVPKEVDVIYDNGSPLFDLYPQSIQYLLEGNIESHQALPLMPPLNYDRLIYGQSWLKLSKKFLERYPYQPPMILTRTAKVVYPESERKPRRQQTFKIPTLPVKEPKSERIYPQMARISKATMIPELKVKVRS